MTGREIAVGSFQVSNVIDGHSFAINDTWEWAGRAGTVIRISDLSAPKANTPPGNEAKEHLKTLIEGKTILVVNPQAVDQYSRLVANVFLYDRNIADYSSQWRI